MACGYLHSYYDRAPVPEGCEAVVMQEQTEQTTMACVLLLKCVAGKIFAVAVRYLCRCGCFPGGNSPDYRRVPVIASLGIAEVPVIRKVRVRFFLPVMNSSCPVSRWATANLRYQPSRRTPDVRTVGMRGINLGIIRDDPHDLRAAFIEATARRMW